ncbi:MAG: hypothetical protein H0W30_00285 [Gemmatimonadaceae bacterium]|nr:hypothetical protein [Gemmatimonadaceae bacterium]MDQ3517800.1 hypothetical protein [Gemmatimonadota bacterium]
MSRGFACLAFAILSWVSVSTASAQSVAEPAFYAAHRFRAGADTIPGSGILGTAPFGLTNSGYQRPSSGPWWAPLASALVPGAGQALQSKQRALPYVATEAFLLVQYIDSRRTGRVQRGEYRDLAQIARSFFTDRFPVGDFEYYERMQHFIESGAFDVNPGGELEPEPDESTFNGTTWRLARLTYWDDPEVAPPRDSEEFRRSIDFYADRAIQEEFRWSWRNAQFEQDVFSRTIQRSNSAFRLSSQYLGVLIANHALSAVDAFITLRLSRGRSPSHTYQFDASIPWAPLGRSSKPAIGDSGKQ